MKKFQNSSHSANESVKIEIRGHIISINGKTYEYDVQKANNLKSDELLNELKNYSILNDSTRKIFQTAMELIQHNKLKMDSNIVCRLIQFYEERTEKNISDEEKKDVNNVIKKLLLEYLDMETSKSPIYKKNSDIRIIYDIRKPCGLDEESFQTLKKIAGSSSNYAYIKRGFFYKEKTPQQVIGKKIVQPKVDGTNLQPRIDEASSLQRIDETNPKSRTDETNSQLIDNQGNSQLKIESKPIKDAGGNERVPEDAIKGMDNEAGSGKNKMNLDDIDDMER